MSDTLVTLFSIRSATKICDFRNQDFEILIPTYASLELFFYCLGWYLSNGQLQWKCTWTDLKVGASVARLVCLRGVVVQSHSTVKNNAPACARNKVRRDPPAF